MLSRLMLMDERAAAALITGLLACCALLCNLIIWALLGRAWEFMTFMNPIVIATIVGFPPFLGIFKIARENRALRLAHRAESRRSFTNFVTNAEFRQASNLEFGRARLLEKPFSMLAIAISDFHKVQDTWGREPARDLQQELGHRISRQLGEYDFFCLYGEYFLVVLPGHNQTAAENVCQHIQTAVAADTFGMEFSEISIGISCGLTARERLAESDTLTEIIGETACQICLSDAPEPAHDTSDITTANGALGRAQTLDELIEQVHD